MVLVMVKASFSLPIILLLSSSCKTALAQTAPPLGCFIDLNEVANRVAAKSPSDVETFVLCPDTVYQIGFLGSGGVIEDGFPALLLRQNTHYRCGEDGKSTNNCIISGGQFQIISTFNSFNEEPKVNVRLDGITFTDGDTAGAVLVAPGDVIFTDCIFRVGHFVAGSVLQLITCALAFCISLFHTLTHSFFYSLNHQSGTLQHRCRLIAFLFGVNWSLAERNG